MGQVAGRPGRPLLLAHRGDHRQAAENTLAAFQAAAALPGCDGVELDVRLSADGEAVVLHDATLDRVQGRPGRASDLTARELVALGVPRLADVLDSVPPTFFVHIELKETDVRAVAVVLGARRSPGDGVIAVSSFDPAILESLAAAAPQWPRWLIKSHARKAFTLGRDLGCQGLALQVRSITSRLVEQCHGSGIEIMAWTARDSAERARMADLGVDVICAEGPGLERIGASPSIDERDVQHAGEDQVLYRLRRPT